MPVMGGLKAAERSFEASLHTSKVLLVGSHVRRAYVEEAFRRGAKVKC